MIKRYQFPTYLLAILVMPFLLTACAEWTPKKCAQTSWYNEGKRVGVETKPMNTMYAAQDACRRANVPVDMKAYEAGWNAGLRETCNGQRGYELGANGEDRAKYVCPAPFDRAFYSGFERGIRKYCTSSKLAFARGRAGEPMPNCPGDLNAEFRAEYQRGLALHEQVQAVQGRIDQLNSQASDISQRMREEREKDNANPNLLNQYQQQYDRLQDQILELRQQMTMLKVI